MSANCINQAYYRRNTVAICPSITRFHVTRFWSTYFLSSIICLAPLTGLEPAIYDLEDRCISCCATEAFWCASWDSNPEKTRGLNPPHLPFCHKRKLWCPRRDSNPQKTRILSPAHMPKFCYTGILVSPLGLEPRKR